jgi:hypothetical protein
MGNMMRRPPELPADVAPAFAAFPKTVGQQLMRVRALIFATAAELEGVGTITETLKWGEPAYLTEASGSGSTIRLGRPKALADTCAVLFNCRTRLVETFRMQFPETFIFEKNRAILFGASQPLPRGPLCSCLAMALTYHQRR